MTAQDPGHTPTSAELADMFGLVEERDHPGLTYSRTPPGHPVVLRHHPPRYELINDTVWTDPDQDQN